MAAKLGDGESERRAVEQGVNFLSRANELTPGHPFILAKLAQFTSHQARLAAESQDISASHQLAEEALRLADAAFGEPTADEEALEACATVFTKVLPEKYRDSTAAVEAYERIMAIPDFVEDMEFLVSFTRALAGDGQWERARAMQQRALARLPAEETYYRQRLLTPFTQE